MKHGKKYIEAQKVFERSKLYDSEEALSLCVKTGTAKFDETVEVHVKLGVDGRHADQQVRGAIVLPNGNRQKCPRAGDLQTRKNRRSRKGRRRFCRWPGYDRKDPGRLDGFRRSDHPRPT